jgi:hypothetical protein
VALFTGDGERRLTVIMRPRLHIKIFGFHRKWLGWLFLCNSHDVLQLAHY